MKYFSFHCKVYGRWGQQLNTRSKFALISTVFHGFNITGLQQFRHTKGDGLFGTQHPRGGQINILRLKQIKNEAVQNTFIHSQPIQGIVFIRIACDGLKLQGTSEKIYELKTTSHYDIGHH